MKLDSLVFQQHVVMMTHKQVGSILDCKDPVELLAYRNRLLENALLYFEHLTKEEL